MSYYPSCDESYNSLTDALKSIKEDGSYENRKKIANLNGISEYKGSPEQNIELLDKLKQGKLIKSGDVDKSSDSDSFEQKIKNIENSKEFGEKTHAMVIIGNLLFEKNYETAFVAGLLANLYHEGNYGYFESSAYKSNPKAKPKYLAIMDENYQYKDKYSGKCVTEVSLLELKKIVDILENDKWKNGKFGLGIFQWTGERTGTLIKLYLKENGGKDNITLDQVIAAEGKMTMNEFENINSYKNIYSDLKNKYSNNLNSEEAAYYAGSEICLRYEVPDNKEQRANDRGNTSKRIFNIMMGK